uniref:Major facilitator superfamily (MFS) profile domain-containing protein n=2 Tax=Clastoptera arizonana TaxID=38151 RepID=A0A1B6CLX1_9HEMI
MTNIEEKTSIRLAEDGAVFLETDEEYRQRWFSIRIMYFTMFLMALGFSIVLTGVWPYLDELDPTAGKEFMGYVVAANPLGQMLFSPLVGWWGNHRGSVRLPLITSLLVFTVASGGYSTLQMFPSYKKYWMLFFRFLVGVSSANIAICRSYLSAATKLEERTGAVSMVSLAQVLGFIVGPGLQAAVTPLGEEGISLFSNKIPLNMYTAAGWINVVLGLLNGLLLCPGIFKERTIAAKEAMVMKGVKTEEAAWKDCKPDYLSAWTMIVAFFVLVFNFVLLETLGTSLTMDQFAWSKVEALKNIGILLSIGAVVACASFIIIGPLSKRFNECSVLLWGGFLLMVLGRALYLPWGGTIPITEPQPVNGTAMNDTEPLGCPHTQQWCLYTPAMTVEQFLIGFVLTAIGYPIGVTLIQTIFSKVLGARPQGVWMGLMTGSGCLSRVLGPVFVSLIYTHYGTIWTFGMTTLMMVGAMVWLRLFLKRIKASIYKATKNETKTEDYKEDIPLDVKT